MSNRILLIAVIATLLLSGCATTEYVEDERDPWQGFNRSVYSFNDSLDKAVLKPVAKGYEAITPKFARTGVRNFFNNVDDVSVAANNLLQGKVGNAVSDVGRFLVNTTLGILGFFDVATPMGLRKHDEDFGQTLAAWGVGQGPYVVLPILGPSTVRHAPSYVVDRVLLNPITYIELKTGERVALIALRVVSVRAELLSLEEQVEDISTDQYAFIRDVFLDRREFLIHDGNPPADESLYEGLDDDD
jgi:phospholipid-binding lipoprotein MlaA